MSAMMAENNRPPLTTRTGNPYWHVVNTYLTRKLFVLIMLFFGMVGAATIFTSGKNASPGYVFLIFPAFFAGAHLKQQIATPEATVVPGYRGPHLWVGAAFLLIPVILGLLTPVLKEQSVLGHLAVICALWTAGLSIAACGDRVSALAFAFVYLPMLAPPMRMAVAELLAGEQSGLAICLLSAAAALAARCFHRLTVLSEEDAEYAKVMPLNPWDVKPAAVRQRNKIQLQASQRTLSARLGTASALLDKTADRPGVARSRRITLWRLATDWPMNAWATIPLMLFIEVLPLQYIDRDGMSQDLFASLLAQPLMISMALQWVCWLPMIQRWSRLGYESLRPLSRRDWVVENASAILRNVVQLQILWLAVQLTLLLIFFRPFVTSPVIPNALIFLAGLHVLAFGYCALITSVGSIVLKAIGLMCLFGASQGTWMAMFTGASFLDVRVLIFAS